MTTMTFNLSATTPNAPQQKIWGANWTGPATHLLWMSTDWPDGSRGPGPATTGDGAITGNSIDVPAYDTLGRYDQEWVGIPYAGLDHEVRVNSFMTVPYLGPAYTEQSITLTSEWNSVKDIEISSISSGVLDVSGFVNTWINAPDDNNNHKVNIDEAKRGSIALGDGNDQIKVGVAANEYNWSSNFKITTGNGNDTVSVTPETYPVLAVFPAPYGSTFNYAPQLTTADISVGDGNNTVSLAEVSGTIHVGSGTDVIDITDGASSVWLGSGNDKVTIGSHPTDGPGLWAFDTAVGTSTIYAGSGHADVTVDNTNPLTPWITLSFMRGETGGSTFATADVVRYGHFDADIGSFVGADLSTFTINLTGYSQGSTASLTTVAAGSAMLQIHDAATGSVDAVALYGAAPIDTGSLNLHFT